MIKMTAYPRELVWLAPFLCIALMILGLVRPLPKFPVPDHSRVVRDARGMLVHIEMPYRGTALTWGVNVQSYLHESHAPESLLNVWNNNREHFSKEAISWVYPQVLKNKSLWEGKAASLRLGANAEIESLLAYDPGVYLGIGYGPVPLLRRVGLPAAYTSLNTKSVDERFFAPVRVETSVTGHADLGEALIREYRKDFLQLEQELQPATLGKLPRVLPLAVSSSDWGQLYVRTSDHEFQVFVSRAGLANAADGYESVRTDPERILAMEPDLIFLLWGENPREFMRDPRWRGMKAVRERRVYLMPGSYPGYVGTMQFRPLWTRWMAEIAHPDRMRPQLRQVLRDHFIREFGYYMTDDQIDGQLHVEENKGSAGYQRFTGNYQPGNRQEPAQ